MQILLIKKATLELIFVLLLSAGAYQCTVHPVYVPVLSLDTEAYC
ncbi:hypothetical protein [Ferroplasma acidiphilum]|nr:hypothetical protein [Ferroplasma acidiphilum]